MAFLEQELANFEKLYLENKFILHNCTTTYQNIILSVKNNKISLIKQGDNFLFLQNKPKILTFFISNENKKYSIENCYLKLIIKHKEQIKRFDNFLKQNNFELFKIFKAMHFSPKSDYENFDFIDFANINEVSEIYDFLTLFFDANWCFLYSKDDLVDKITQNEILVDRYKDKISAILIFSKSFANISIDYIVAQSNNRKNSAYALMSKLITINSQTKNFKLFVDENNIKAINFYTRFGFEFNDTKLLYYKNNF
ncbi:GNAT family N-acetyltransferase [Campylobacter sp. 9BO]|uniref:GNAT family N-acetyltransferase n=1 Tax=Campylobacter sp. 9BO TaxID=3424759 RepID=UPI003D344DAA